jgi:hypothetical protein
VGKNLYLRIVEGACEMEPCKHAMTNADVQRVRNHLAALEVMLHKRFAGAGDEESLLEFRRLCWAALLLVDDAECQAQIDLLVQHAKDLFRGGDAADGVKSRLDAALAACSARLDMVEGGYGKRWRDLRAA